MNKIYLDKLCDFAFTTYKNYEIVQKNYDFDDFVNNIKQNQSLNEKGIFLKHNFIELKTLFPDTEYDQLILINPICFNLSGNVEWFNFLNTLLTIMNDSYLHESNLIKKTILETADKTFRKKIIISNNIDDKIISKVCELINVTLIIFSKQSEKIKLFNYSDKVNKIVVMVNVRKEYFSVLNWNQKYFSLDSEFIKYLIDKNNYQNTQTIKFDDKNNDKNDEQQFIKVINKKNKKNKKNIDEYLDIDKQIYNKSIKSTKLSKSSKSSKSFKLSNDDIFDFNSDDENFETNLDTNLDDGCINIDMNNNKKLDYVEEDNTNKGTYEELQADENYALYVSEVVDNNIKNNKSSSSTDKKKKRGDKNIFVTNKQEINTQEKQQLEKKIAEELDESQSSVFNKTEKINKKDIEEISNNIKSSMGLEFIQAQAIKLGISVFEGSTKSGKPKNKTKSELIDQIKEYIKNFKD